jgi:HAD superfamily hydrolase (TIGR01549 family)
VLRAVLFDLDDTLFDHRVCARTALTTLHEAYDAFRNRPFEEVERLHASFLEELHVRVTSGELPLEQARRERFRRLFTAVGVTPGDDVVVEAAETYRGGYMKIRRAVAGAAALLAAVKARSQVGIVSNNLLEEQQGKLRQCGLDRFVDELVVSEEAGMSKPDPRIFQIALDRLGCRADQVVMVGDSWAADVIGARAAGVRAIWFNPEHLPSPEPDGGVVELHSLEPVDAALATIFASPGEAGSTTEPDQIGKRARPRPASAGRD